ncbi:hypothetical protein TBLA_0B00280 [Henningerozyma blattae CBS 6284]|uniref:Required for respiratory growth protein 9, mitochondrial n=1 Tax=Henningerozyma blattae (strain ATCC 34711 / CBS 6284 / DSM 70876 / NBRC 10599 / NRRL Y-10934 / UCD 77-7) TaxID=1071380 RepID=I2GXM1_HENB6|nr:hypothetical protein TBLA_0B00280 [Tetrapisispora blattae CBS 6284]CCH58873.1 hypothetical protein TBLA_0B00280 [Tetrapisispora blattae CBS 6284]
MSKFHTSSYTLKDSIKNNNISNKPSNNEKKLPRLKINPPSAQQVINFINQSSTVPDKEKQPEWLKQKLAIKKKISGERWEPKKKVSRDDMYNIKFLKQRYPDLNATQISQIYKVSPDAIRRILKSNWSPNEKELSNLQERWTRRGERIKELTSLSKKVVPDTNEIIPKNIIRLGQEVNGIRNYRTFERKSKYIEDKKDTKHKKNSKLYLLKRLHHSK